MAEERIWHIYTDKGAQGPYTVSEIRAWKNAGQLTDDWYVWRDGFANWQRLGDTRELLPPPDTAAPVFSELASPQAVPSATVSQEPQRAAVRKQPELKASEKTSINVREYLNEIIAGVLLALVAASVFLLKSSDLIIYTLIVSGLVLAILGIIMKPANADIGWSPLFGIAANSTPAGKGVFFLGVMVLIMGVRLMIRPMNVPVQGPQGYPVSYGHPQCEPLVKFPVPLSGTGCIRDSIFLPWRPLQLGGYCSATVVQWEPDGILDAAIEEGSASCPSTPETRRIYVLGINPGDAPPGGPPMSPDAAAWAAQHFPPGTKFWADPDTTKTLYQTPGATYIVLGYPKDLYGKIFYEIFKENGKQ